MTDPIEFTAQTARHGFPLLVAGQAQKEFFVNEALARIDAQLHPVIQGEASNPPAQPSAGQSWIIGVAASGAWTGHENALASWDGTQWTFAAPMPGQMVYDMSGNVRRCFDGSWQSASAPLSPESGTTVDIEAQMAIDSILDILRLFKLTA